MVNWCRLGFHDYHYVKEVFLVEDKCGPFDPRDETTRTRKQEEFICCRCGKIELEPKRDLDHYYGY